MSKKRQKYYHIKFFEKKKKLCINRCLDFEVTRTTYTRKILFPNNEEWIFNAEADTDKAVLILIQLVRNDAKKYIQKHGTLLNFKRINFFGLFNVFEDDEVVCKIDIRSAYWSLSLQKGIISQETNEIFKKLAEPYDNSYGKDLRLKALGSLATTKFKQIYQKGKLVFEKPYPEPTKPLYMEICLEIDKVMKRTNKEIEGCIYYYWDCIFVKENSSNEVVEFLKTSGYDCSVNETKISYIKVGDNGYIYSQSDEKVYMTKKENYQRVKDGIEENL